MYASYFGLSEAPFSISPDPRFLYMSDRHREAMAHLMYGLQEGGGFVQLTGEVGTGKTTLCRCLLLQLPEHVDVALILNPQISHAELLATLCDELKISCQQNDTPKVLLDRLNERLLETYAEGKRTVLIIDEAQLLTRTVLEQVRILTNLETTKQKLLQIILIGQPELSDTLNRQDLKQLAQRITARYHLEPLNAADTREYVRYRLAVAGCTTQLFSQGALSAIYRFTRGVPRLINVICDRCLLGAYTSNAKKISTSIVRNAGAGGAGRFLFSKISVALDIGGGRVLGFGGGCFGCHKAGTIYPNWRRQWVRRPPVPRVNVTAPTEPAAGAGPVSADKSDPIASDLSEVSRQTLDDGDAPAGPDAQPSRKPIKEQAETGQDGAVPNLVQPILTIDPLDVGAADTMVPGEEVELSTVLASGKNDYQRMFGDLVTRWQPESMVANVSLNCDEIEHLGLRCLSKQGTWSSLRNYNRAALLLLYFDGEEFPVLLTRLGDKTVTVEIENVEHTYPTSEVEKFWQGQYLLLWRPPPLEYDEISIVSKGPDVLWLRQALNRIAQRDGSGILEVASSDYDEALRSRVIAFQRNHRIDANGVVGVDTLIQLNTLLNESDLPLLSRSPTT